MQFGLTASGWLALPLTFSCLNAAATHVVANRLASSHLQQPSFGPTKRAVWDSETGHIEAPYGPFDGPMWHTRKGENVDAEFSCIFATTIILCAFIISFSPCFRTLLSGVYA